MTYLVVLAGIFLASAWLEVVVRTRVFRRWRRLLLTLAGTVAPLVLWGAFYFSKPRGWED